MLSNPQVAGVVALASLVAFAIGWALDKESRTSSYARGARSALDQFTIILGQEDPDNFAHRVRQRDRIERRLIEPPLPRCRRHDATGGYQPIAPAGAITPPPRIK